MTQDRKQFTKEQICDYWQDRHERITTLTDVCWCCGEWCYKTEKAHIVALCDGGLDEPSNIHLLCPSCHLKTEGLSEDQYWKYLSRVKWDFQSKMIERYETLVAIGAIEPVSLVN